MRTWIERGRWRNIPAFLLVAAAQLIAVPAWAQQAVPAPEWSALFQRSSGWTGADGIFSFSTDGWDAPDDPRGNVSTIFTFDDTFIGRVDTSGARASGVAIVHGSAARLRGRDPEAGRIGFVWGHQDGVPAALVTPATPAALPGEWYWSVDGLVTTGVFHLFEQRMTQTESGGVFNFAVTGIDLVSEAVASLGNPAVTPSQLDMALTVPAAGSQGLEQFGNAVMANTTEAGSPLSDGWVYVYGVRNDSATKWLLAARVLPTGIADISQYRFWDGTGWVSDITEAAPIIDRISSEFSVTPLANGLYALVYQLDDLSDQVAISYGSSPVGPFSKALVIYTCPEPAEYAGEQVYTYNAKAHPALSAPGHLLISYNVNSFSLQDNLDNASIYYPRFIDLDLGGLTGAAEGDRSSAGRR